MRKYIKPRKYMKSTSFFCSINLLNRILTCYRLEWLRLRLKDSYLLAVSAYLLLQVSLCKWRVFIPCHTDSHQWNHIIRNLAGAVADIQDHPVKYTLFSCPSKPEVLASFEDLTVLVFTGAPLTDIIQGHTCPCSRTHQILIQTQKHEIQFHCSSMVYSTNWSW